MKIIQEASVAFTKKHFIMIANLIRNFDFTNIKQKKQMIDAFITMFESDNPMFNANTFRTACLKPAEQDSKEV